MDEIKVIESKCRNCGLTVISTNDGRTWSHGIRLESGKPWLTPINSPCEHPSGTYKDRR